MTYNLHLAFSCIILVKWTETKPHRWEGQFRPYTAHRSSDALETGMYCRQREREIDRKYEGQSDTWRSQVAKWIALVDPTTEPLDQQVPDTWRFPNRPYSVDPVPAIKVEKVGHKLA